MKAHTIHYQTYTPKQLASQLGYSGAAAFIKGTEDGKIYIEVQYPEVECEPK